MRSLRTVPLLVVLSVATAGAQAYNYPLLMVPRAVEREYNFAAASGSRSGTSLIFQWREGLAPGREFTLDGGLAAPPGGADSRLLMAFGLAGELARASSDNPFDMLLTGSLGGSFGGGSSILRVPVGLLLGSTFDLDDGYSITPFAHPRVALDACSSCRAGKSDTKLGVDVDLGFDFRVATQLSFRVGALLGGSDFAGGNGAIGLSVSWMPKGVK